MEKLLPYKAPSWALKLRDIPSVYVKLASRPTPIQRWQLNSVPANFQVSIKRDDMTGSTLSGNKVRKLEFLIADAIKNGYDGIATCGGIQSNHCRASAVAAKQVGLKCYLLLRSGERIKDSECTVGNVTLDRLAGAQVYLVPNESLEGGLWKRLEKLSDCLRKEKNEKIYKLPLGGSNHIGTFGYIEAFQELINQGVLEQFDDLFLAVGSGGTAAGLSIANYLTGSKVKIHAVCVCDTDKYFYDHVQRTLEKAGLNDVKATDIIDIIPGYKGRGYALSTEEELEQLIDISQSTGILLDPVYNLKAVRGMLTEMDKNPARFKGSRVLYLFTGGVFSLFDGRLSKALLKKVNNGQQTFTVWNDVENDPLSC